MKFKYIATLLLLCLSSAQAAEPSKNQILRWLGKTDKVSFEKIHEVTLKGGEPAYLISAEFPDRCRNCLRGYILARPQQGKAMELKEFNSQANNVDILDDDPREGDVLVLWKSYTGQGVYDSVQTVVVLDGWEVKKLFTAKGGDNSGECDDENDLSCPKERKVFLNFIGPSDKKKMQLAVTTVKSIRYKRDISSRILTLPDPR